MLAKTAYIKETKQDIKIKTSVLNSEHQTLMVLKNGFGVSVLLYGKKDDI